jgi:uncharacterized protein YdeI (YjbR/CyaY-like superfamily)
MEKDDEPRAIATPPDLLKALSARKSAKAAWDKLSYTHRKEYINAIEEAKKPETRARRIAKAVEMIAPISNLIAWTPKKQEMKKTAKKTAKKSAKRPKK